MVRWGALDVVVQTTRPVVVSFIEDSGAQRILEIRGVPARSGGAARLKGPLVLGGSFVFLAAGLVALIGSQRRRRRRLAVGSTA